MALAELWYHDENEVDEKHSWLKNSPYLISNTIRKSYDNCKYSKVLALIEYARPDFILTVDGTPLVSVEITEMNPSGHNLPQRFSCLLRASEMGIPSILYYPEYSRRSTSDPNPRFLNVRLPLAQLRMSEIFGTPSISMFWPTDKNTLLPSHNIADHLELAKFIEYTLKIYLNNNSKLTNSDSKIIEYKKIMTVKSRPVKLHNYTINTSFRRIYPDGDCFTKSVLVDTAIDPPSSCTVNNTQVLLQEKFSNFGKDFNKVQHQKKMKLLTSRTNTFVYTGTANNKKTGPEHPYPGYLTLLDILYLREQNGQTPRDRTMNLAFVLPITLDAYISNAINRPTGLNIIMEFADMIFLEDAIVLGGWLRNVAAGAVLVKR